MDIISVIITISIIVLVLILQYRCSTKEGYDTVGLDYGRPPTMPPTAYAALTSPEITSEYNKNIPNVNYQPNNTNVNGNYIYPDKVCATPSNLRPFNSDSCAQYGIGEIVEGPINAQRCVCVTELKPGLDPKTTVPTADNVVVGMNGVCTKNEQCITGFCDNIVGGFSKICKCPKDPNGIEQYFDLVDNKCKPVHGVPKKNPANLCSTFRKPARYTYECSLGEAVTPDGFCSCQLTNPGTINEGKFMAGANCTEDSQCMNNLKCGQDPDKVDNKICVLPHNDMFLQVGPIKNMYATCADPSLEWDDSQKKCVKPNRVKSDVCPNSYNTGGKITKCSSNTECGIGEICDPTSMLCYCDANMHSKKIAYGGKCNNDSQCDSGSCIPIMDNYSICK